VHGVKIDIEAGLEMCVVLVCVEPNFDIDRSSL
jgi:hypothetical protein